MAFNVSYVFQAVDKFSAVADKIKTSMQGIRDVTEQVTQSMERNAEKVSSLGKKLSLGVTAPITAIGGLALNAAAEQEKLNMQMLNIIGNAEKAQALGAQLEKIKMNSPIDVGAVDDAALRLLVMGTSVDKVSGIIDNFAKISAGSGQSLDSLVESFAIAQTGPEGMSRALNQLNRRVPVIAELQKMLKEKTGVSATTKQIREMAAQGRISIEALQEAFARMTKEGGKFFNSIDTQSKTLTGSLQLLRNNFARFRESLGFAIMGSVDLSGAILSINEAMKKAVVFVEEFAKNNPELTKTIVIFAMIAAAIGPVLVGLGSAITAISNVVKAILFFMSPVGLMVAGIISAAGALFYLYTKFEWVRNVIDFVVGGIFDLVTSFPKLSAAVAVVVGTFLAAGKASLLLQAVTFALRMAALIPLMGSLASLAGIMKVVTAAQAMLSAAFIANPIGLMVAAVAALVAGIVYLLNKFGLLEGILKTIKGWADSVAQAFRDMFNFDFAGKIDALKNSVSGIAGSIKDKVTGFFGGSQVPSGVLPPLPNGGLNQPPLVNDNINLGAQTIRTESQSSVDINLKGNRGAIESVKSKTDGKTNLAVSQNMAYTY